MGTSLLYRQPVADIITQRFCNSIWILLAAWIFSGVLGITFGMISGIKEGTLLDSIIKNIAILFSSTPIFWFALLVLMIFSVWLKWFPIGLSVPIGVTAENVTIADKIYHGILPNTCINYYRNVKCYIAYKRKNDYDTGKRLCFVCKSNGKK